MGVGIKIVATWTVGLGVGFFLRAVLPSGRGLGIVYGGVQHFIPFGKLLFWLCVAICVAISLTEGFHVLRRDLGL